MPKLLIVDDVLDNVKLLAYDLSDEGYAVITAHDGRQALAAAKSERPDVILLDVMMPEMDGIEVCRRLKSDPELRTIPVILVSAKSLDEDVVTGLDAGAEDYVTKPFNSAIVAARVRSAVRIKGAFDTIERMNGQLEEARRFAEAASTSKSEFLANMSHEIRTPMTAILGYAENLLDPDLPEAERRDAIRTILRNGDYLQSIIDDILDLSKIEVGKMTLERIGVCVCTLVAEIMSLVRVRADAKGLTFRVEYAGAIPETIQTDPTRLRQILINLIGNAIKFTETGEVRLVTSFIEGHTPVMQFDVVDTGIGMTGPQAANLFQPFQQADASTTRKFGGTGLGLSISQRLARMLGGQIVVVETQPQRGSRLRATVATGTLDGVRMIEDPGSATVIREDRATADRQSQKSALAGGRLLLVEDGPDNQRLITHILRRAGAEVVLANNGLLAIEAAQNAQDEGKPFDVILMDMQMPVMDGYQASAALRRKGYTRPIIALTAHAMATDRRKCLDAGCDDFASKPIDRAKLIETIRNHLGAERQAATADQPPGGASSDNASPSRPDVDTLAELFIEALPARVEAIEKALAEQDLTTLATGVHQLQGAAGGYGFPEITRAAKQIDLSSEATEHPAQFEASVQRLIQQCRVTQDRVGVG